VPKAKLSRVERKHLERRIAQGKEPGFGWVRGAIRHFGNSK